MIWSEFISQVGKTPEQLNISLGEKNCISILDVPFRAETTTVHNLGAAYIQLLPNDTLKIAPIQLNNLLGISQSIAILDVMLTLSEEESLSPRMISTFSVADKTFTSLTEEAILLFQQHQSILAEVNTPECSSTILENHQFVFHNPNEEPL